MGDIHYEEHIENLIKMRSELRSAVGSYKIGNTGAEMYFMCRAKAVADALGISKDEFLEHKTLVEKEEGMVDSLMEESSIITEYNDMEKHLEELAHKMETYPKPKDITLHTVIYASIYDNDFSSTNFTSYKEAEEYFAKKVKYYFDLDKREEDSYGNKFEECVNRGQAFFEDNERHGDIYIWFTVENKFKL